MAAEKSFGTSLGKPEVGGEEGRGEGESEGDWFSRNLTAS